MSEHIEDLGDWLNGWSENDYQEDIGGYMRMRRIPFRGASAGPFSEPKVYEFWTEVPTFNDVSEVTGWVTNQRWEVTVREIVR